MPDWKYDIFISYSRHDESFVDFCKHCLELAGLRCFRDTSVLGVYDKLDAALKIAISQSRWLMAVISPAYLQSYWCLFEALEAIQGQNVALRFLPIVLRNRPGDEILNEDFVFGALRDLREQMGIFEAKMIAERAFGLSAKLDKLAFVQNQLPKVFSLIHDRIYPTFDLWNEAMVRTKMRELLAYVAPNSDVDINAVQFVVSRSASMPVVLPRLSQLPEIVWKTEIGCQSWKNNVVAIGNDVLVTSSGRVWNEPDEMDGIYCLHAETGKTRWFASTLADANHLMVSKGMVITGCDDGSVVAVRQLDGVQEWAVRLDSAVVGGPLRLPANLGRIRDPDRDTTEPILVSTYEGKLYILDQMSGREIDMVELGAPMLGAPSITEDLIIVPMLTGDLKFVQYSYISIGFGSVHELTIAGDDLNQNSEERSSFTELAAQLSKRSAFVELAAQPCLAGRLILQGLVRDTYYDPPPLAAIDADSLNIRWFARAPADLDRGIGNLRSPPAAVGGEAVFAPAYSSRLFAVSLETGMTTWTVDLGQKLFEQWSGPVAVERSIFIGRHDGYLHKVSSIRHRREWSIFLGNHGRAGAVVTGSQHAPEFADSDSWSAGSSSPILATPTVDGGRLYVGTDEGWLYCIGNLGTDDPDF